jgi:4-hydroxybenzoate polyprenyltransferase
MAVGRSTVRAAQWWGHKLPPVIAAACLVLFASRSTSQARDLRDVLLLLMAASGIAAFGHVINDLADLAPDGAAGKRNVMALVGTSGRIGLVVVTLAVGLVPFVWLPHRGAVIGLITLEVVLLVAYSVPPTRLKERAAAGVACDAIYAYLIPIALTLATFGARPGTPTIAWWVTTPTLIWAFLMGVRGIVSHQVIDLDNDRRAGVDTLVARIGVDRAVGWTSRLVLIEFAAAAATIGTVSVGMSAPWLAVFGAAYLAWRTFQIAVLWDEPLLRSAPHDRDARLRLMGFVLLNEFVEKWLPPAALVALAVRHPIWWAVVAVYLIAFDNALVEFIARDARSLPDAVERVAFERKARRLIRQAQAERIAVTAAGPAEVTESARDGRRWVFVVCGPDMHLRTLHTAVSHLRPLTRLEIWVVTDTSRNEGEIDRAGIDQVVDVATPTHLDDHQASIWLKTGVHRHLPSGEWCYLDTDIIAVAPGAEAVFDHRHGPVAFASDLTIVSNEVDRFSPWAMTCGCSGHGDEHSCGHLREQLEIRYGLEVPGTWTHWNGGVFVFGPDAGAVLDMWNERAVASFDWPEWRTRDQGALIATVWTLGLQDLPRLPAMFNFIADLGNGDLCLDLDRGWALHPAGPFVRPHLMHLYTSRLEDDGWDLGNDVEAPVIRQTLVRTYRWRRRRSFDRFGVYRYRLRRIPRRLQPGRVTASARRRLGRYAEGRTESASTTRPDRPHESSREVENVE